MPIVTSRQPWARNSKRGQQQPPPPPPPASPDRLPMQSIHLPTNQVSAAIDGPKSARPSTASAALRLLKRRHPKLSINKHQQRVSSSKSTAEQERSVLANRTNGRSVSSAATTTTSKYAAANTNTKTTQPKPTEPPVDHAQQAYDGGGSTKMLRKLEGQDDNEQFIAVERVDCPYCTRKFAPDAHKRHIIICANNKSKPKPPPQAVECYTDRFGIRRGGRGSLATSARVSGEGAMDKRRRPSSQQQSTRRTSKENQQQQQQQRRTRSRPSSSSASSRGLGGLDGDDSAAMGNREGGRTRAASSRGGSAKPKRSAYRAQISADDIAAGSGSATTQEKVVEYFGDAAYMEAPPELPSELDQLHAMGDQKFGKRQSSRARRSRGRTSKTTKKTTTATSSSSSATASAGSGAEASPPMDVNEQRVLKLSNKWGELMFLLRKPINSSDTLKSTWQSAMNGVKFLQELQETANDLGVQQGTLSRWLLPFDNQTSLADQAATAPPLGASDLDGLMSHAQRRRLVSEAVGLRSLIRVKIADNADLEQASASVSAIDTFMYRVKQTAQAMNMEPYTLFQRL